MNIDDIVYFNTGPDQVTKGTISAINTNLAREQTTVVYHVEYWESFGKGYKYKSRDELFSNPEAAFLNNKGEFV